MAVVTDIGLTGMELYHHLARIDLYSDSSTRGYCMVRLQCDICPQDDQACGGRRCPVIREQSTARLARDVTLIGVVTDWLSIRDFLRGNLGGQTVLPMEDEVELRLDFEARSTILTGAGSVAKPRRKWRVESRK